MNHEETKDKDQSPVEWLKEKLPSLFLDDSGHYQDLFEEALRRERERDERGVKKSIAFADWLNERLPVKHDCDKTKRAIAQIMFPEEEGQLWVKGEDPPSFHPGSTKFYTTEDLFQEFMKTIEGKDL